MKIKLLFLILFLSLPTFAQNAKENFSVVVEGSRSGLNYIKTRSELTMARSTKFCRGSKMPKAVGQWSCKNTAPRLSNCVLEYKCSYMNKGFNRVSESRRLRAKLKDIPHLQSKYSISLLYKDKKEILQQLGGKTQVKKTSSRSFSPQKLKGSRQAVKKKRRVMRSKRNKSPTPVAKRTVRKKTKQTVSEEELEELAFLKDDELDKLTMEEEQIEEEVLSPSEVKSLDKEEEIELSGIKKAESQKSKSPIKTELASFALHYIMISDDLDSSLSTIGFSWTPHLWFNENIGVRGDFGFHSYSTTETEFAESESFSIYDLGLFGIYKFSNIYLELGVGLQKWNHEDAENSSTLSYGIGYRFDNKRLYILDRVSFGMSSLSNEAGTKELKISLGGSF